MSVLHCFFCGGKECKYENWKLWTDDKYAGVNAIDGLFCNWITNDILAMQRPSTRLMKKYDLVKKFQQLGIGSIFNLQEAGEHASCGDGIEPASGFSYLPETWMDNGILYYNFGWTDMDTPDNNIMMNLVQVMSYALENGKKIAVHCHAGLGRTGLSIACYLVYGESIRSETAILQIRSKRQNSYQDLKATLDGYSWYSPGGKPSHKVPEPKQNPLALTLSLKTSDGICMALSSEIFARFQKEKTQSLMQHLVDFDGIAHLDRKMIAFQVDINNGQWGVIAYEKDVGFLIGLLLYWLQSLKEPLVSNSDIEMIEANKADYKQVVLLLNRDKFQTINFLMSLFRKLHAISKPTLDCAFDRLSVFISTHRNSVMYPYEHWGLASSATVQQDVKDASSVKFVVTTPVQTAVVEHAIVADKKPDATSPVTIADSAKDEADQPTKEAVEVTEPPHATPVETKPLFGRMSNSATTMQIFGPAARTTAALTSAASTLAKTSIANTLAAVRMTDKGHASATHTDTTTSASKHVYAKAKVEDPAPSLAPLVEFMHFVYQSYKCVDETRAISTETLLPSHDLSPTMNPIEIIMRADHSPLTNLATELSKQRSESQLMPSSGNTADETTTLTVPSQQQQDQQPVSPTTQAQTKPQPRSMLQDMNAAGKRAEALFATSMSGALKGFNAMMPSMSRTPVSDGPASPATQPVDTAIIVSTTTPIASDHSPKPISPK